MTALTYGTAIWLLLLGLYAIATSRNMIQLVGCLFVTQSSTYVLLLTSGYRWGGTAPVLSSLPPGAPLVDPVVQALSLTDVVVGATVAALLLVLAVQGHKLTGSLDPGRLDELKG